MKPLADKSDLRLGMMQPYFLPYIGYFSLIAATDQWVVFDTAQYMRRAWVNRNRILTSGSDPWKYIRIPVLHARRESRICDICVDHRQNWIDQIQQDLKVYRQYRAPFYKQTSEWLLDALKTAVRDGSTAQASEADDACCTVGPGSILLSPLLIRLLRATCDWIDLPFSCRVFSQMQVAVPEDVAAGEWALHTARAVQADTYINAPGGRDLFDAAAFRCHGIQLQVLEPVLLPYNQGGQEFVAGLSILDVLMWNTIEQTQQLIQSYRVDRLP